MYSEVINDKENLDRIVNIYGDDVSQAYLKHTVEYELEKFLGVFCVTVDFTLGTIYYEDEDVEISNERLQEAFKEFVDKMLDEYPLKNKEKKKKNLKEKNYAVVVDYVNKTKNVEHNGVMTFEGTASELYNVIYSLDEHSNCIRFRLFVIGIMGYELIKEFNNMNRLSECLKELKEGENN